MVSLIGKQEQVVYGCAKRASICFIFNVMIYRIPLSPQQFELPHPCEAMAALYGYVALAYCFSRDYHETKFEDFLTTIDHDRVSTAVAIASIIDAYGDVNPHIQSQKFVGGKGLFAFFDTYGQVGILSKSDLIIPCLNIFGAAAFGREKDCKGVFFAHPTFEDKFTESDSQRISDFLRISGQLVSEFVQLIDY